MKIITLVENTTLSNTYKAKHGLCLYIETSMHKILFDLGPNELFLENARKLGINIEEIDTVILSHGHIDHGGGLSAFMKQNQLAKIYIQKSAFQKHYTKVLGLPINVGLKNSISDARVIYIDKQLEIDNELFVFSDIERKILLPQSNKALFMKVGGKIEQDTFEHEQSLIIKEGDKVSLIAGCAHRGIINIQQRAEEIVGKPLNAVIAGFHLYNSVSKKGEKDSLIEEIGQMLSSKETDYFTCHCTGERAYQVLRNMMGEKINYLSTGSQIYL